jgi:hypothetical protein
MDASDPKFLKSVEIAANTLSLCAMLSVKKGWFGKLTPTKNQVGWSYGFCDGYAQSISLECDEDFILFISFVFENVFGKRGLDYFRQVALSQPAYTEFIFQGGSAHHAWVSEGKPPLMPLPA